MYGNQCTPETQREIKALLNYETSSFEEKYLGLEERQIQNFEENKKRMQWMSWERLTRPKSQGDIGFRDLRIFNQALLARQAFNPTS
jgi:hypothetical protein